MDATEIALWCLVALSAFVAIVCLGVVLRAVLGNHSDLDDELDDRYKQANQNISFSIGQPSIRSN